MHRGKLFYFIFGVTAVTLILPLIFAAFYAKGAAHKIVRSEASSRLAAATNAASKELDFFVESAKSSVQNLLTLQERLGRASDDFISAVPQVQALALVTPQGGEVGYFGESGFDYSSMLGSILQNTIGAKQIYVGTARRNAFRKQLFVAAAFPIAPVQSSPATGAAVGEFNLQSLGAALGRISAEEGANLLVFTQNGFLIYSTQEGLATTLNDSYAAKIADILAHTAPGSPMLLLQDGAAQAAEYNAATGWVVSAGVPLASAEAALGRALNAGPHMLLYLLLLAPLLAACAAFLIAGAITHPVKLMTQAAQMIEAGETEALPPLPVPNSELGALALAFGRMLDSITLKFEAMAQDHAALEEINQSLELRVGSRTKELRTALGEMIKKERLAAIGQMASIVSHEIRNPLAVIANSLYLIKARLGAEADPKMLKNITVIEQEIKQANGIIEEILGYARSREQILTTLDLNLYVKEVLASYPMPANITVAPAYAPGAIPVRIDTEEMKQAIRNIIGNAVEVMPAGGTLSVKTRLRSAAQAELSITDSGPGIAPDVQEKIFNPFFTTKARGTGLGLAVVKKVAARNNADIVLASQEGKGTRISILLPVFTPAKEDKNG